MAENFIFQKELDEKCEIKLNALHSFAEFDRTRSSSRT